MNRQLFDINHAQVQLTMVIKLQKLQREELRTLTYRNLESYMMKKVWKKALPGSLNQAVADVWAVHASEIVQFLSLQALVESRDQSLGDFKDLIGGKQFHE